jgi:hypothetical protein
MHTTKLKKQFGEHFTMTDSQVLFLQKTNVDVSLLNCCADAGKSLLLICLCLWILERNDIGARTLVRYIAPSKELVVQFTGLLASVRGSKQDIVPMGFTKEEYVDLADEDLKAKI